MKRRNILLIILLIISVFYFYNRESKKQEFSLEGKTMGVVPYHIKYISKEEKISSSSVQYLLDSLNQIFSTYIPNSQVSQLNQTDTLQDAHPLLIDLLEKSKKIYQLTAGYFDPTLMPLVEAWGFGPLKKRDPKIEEKLDSIRQYVSFDFVQWDKNQVWKTKKNITLDFSAIAKGFVVDQLSDFFLSMEIVDFMIEIGGEVRCQGGNVYTKPWNIQITSPLENTEADTLQKIIVPLSNTSMATSGNYRNFYEENGKRYVHIIHPKTGYPTETNILSASIISPECALADAIATAVMVMGSQKAKEWIKNQPLAEGIFIYYWENRIEVFSSLAK